MTEARSPVDRAEAAIGALESCTYGPDDLRGLSPARAQRLFAERHAAIDAPEDAMHAALDDLEQTDAAAARPLAERFAATQARLSLERLEATNTVATSVARQGASRAQREGWQRRLAQSRGRDDHASRSLAAARLHATRRPCGMRRRTPAARPAARRPQVRRRTASRPARSGADPPGSTEGDDSESRFPRLTFSRFHRLTRRLAGPARLALFVALPAELQDDAWRHLARELDEARG